MFGFNKANDINFDMSGQQATVNREAPSLQNSLLDLDGMFPDLVDYFNGSDDTMEPGHIRTNQINLDKQTNAPKFGEPVPLPAELTLDFDHYRQPMAPLFGQPEESDFSSAISPYLSECPTPTPGSESPSIEELRKVMPKLDLLNVKEIETEDSEGSQFSSADEDQNNGQGGVSASLLQRRLSQLNNTSPFNEQEDVYEEGETFDDSVPGTPRKRRMNGDVNRIAKRASTGNSLVGSDEEDVYEDEEPEDYDSEEEDDEMVGSFSPPTKKYRQPVSLKAENLKIGHWELKQDELEPELVTIDVKILFGRRKIKYEMCKPNKQAKSKTTLLMDFPFSHISGIDFKPKERMIIFQLSEPPTYTKKERGKCSKVTDFTSGNASTFQRHRIEVSNDSSFEEYADRILSCDRRLRQLAKIGLPGGDPAFPNLDSKQTQGPLIACDWDKENRAVKHCEECNANYCDICDDVLHRHATQKTHRRVPVEIFFAPAPQPANKPRKCIKKRKKTNSDRCRCGTGATKGTLGEPCTGNRCPCFSAGRNCSGCGCKNCHNPIKKSSGGRGSGASATSSASSSRKLNIKQEDIEV